MLPGKKYTPEDILRLARRRAWLVVIPLAVATAAAVAIGERLPKKFKSDTLIMLVPQRIPDAYVKSAAGSDNLEDRLATLEDQLLSRSRLERIILDLNLYPSLRNTLPMEDVVQRMRKDITISTTQNKGSKESTSFRIEYISNDARIAQKTTERLASLFIEENMRDRENVAEDTSQFLASQLQDARQRLVEQEKKLEEYRHRYSGQLPSQASANLQAIQNAQLQLQSLREATDRARERQLLLERQLADLQAPDPLVAPMPVPMAKARRRRDDDPAARGGSCTTACARDPRQADASRCVDAAAVDPRSRGEAAGGNGRGRHRDETGEKTVSAADALRQRRVRDLKGADRRSRSRARGQAAAGQESARCDRGLSGQARCRAVARIRSRRVDARLQHTAGDLSKPAREARRIQARCQPRAAEHRRAVPCASIRRASRKGRSVRI